MPNLPKPLPRTLMPDLRGPRRKTSAASGADPQSNSSVVDCAFYRNGQRQDGHDWRDAIDTADATGEGFVWIGLHEPSEQEFDGIAERFGLHPLAVEDAVQAHQRPKLEFYGDMLFAVVKTVYYDDKLPGGTAEVVETGEVMVFLGTNFVITVRHGEHGGLHAVRKRVEDEPEMLIRGPSVALHAVLASIVDSYVVVCQALQEDVDEAETDVFSSNRRVTDSNVIYALKREVLELRRSVAPLAPMLRKLSHDDLPQVAPQVRDYFRDVEDQLSSIGDHVNGYDELLTTLVSANLARVSVVQNEDMRKISAWVAIAAVPTMLAGIYGMNFEHMPELHWEYGYPIVIAVMLTFCGLLYRSFKRNGWL